MIYRCFASLPAAPRPLNPVKRCTLRRFSVDSTVAEMTTLGQFTLCLILFGLLLGPDWISAQQFGSDAPQVIPVPNAEILDPKESVSAADGSSEAALLNSLLDQSRLNQQPLRALQRSWRLNRDPSCFEEILRRTIGLRLRDEFLAFAESGLDQQLTDDQIALQAAVALTDRRKYKAAAAYYQKWLAIKPGRAINYLQILIRIEMGRLYYLSQEYELASAAFREVLQKLDSKQLPAPQKQQLLRNSQTTYRLMARSFLKSGDIKLAEKLFALAHQGSSDPIRFLSQAQIAFAKSDLSAAGDLVRRFIAKQPNNSEAYQILIEVIKAEEPDPALASSKFMTELENFRANYPTGKVLDDLLVKYYLQTNQRDKAIELLEHRRNNSIWKDTANRQLLVIHSGASDLKKLLECVQLEVEDHVNLVKIRPLLTTWAESAKSKVSSVLPADFAQRKLTNQIAVCTLQLHLLASIEKSISAKKTSTETPLNTDPTKQEPTSPPVKSLVQNEPQWSASLKTSREVVRRLQTQIVNSDDLLRRQKTRYLMLLGKECLAMGRYPLAIESFDHCLQLNQAEWQSAGGQRSRLEIYLARTFCYGQLTQSDQALAELKLAEDIQKVSPSVMHLRGWLNLQLGNLDDAIVAYDSFLRKHDRMGNSASLRRLIERARLELALVFFLMKKNQLALEMIHRIYDRNPLGPDLAAFSRNNQKYQKQLNQFFELESGVKHGGPFALGRDQAQKSFDR